MSGGRSSLLAREPPFTVKSESAPAKITRHSPAGDTVPQRVWTDGLIEIGTVRSLPERTKLVDMAREAGTLFPKLPHPRARGNAGDHAQGEYAAGPWGTRTGVSRWLWRLQPLIHRAPIP